MHTFGDFPGDRNMVVHLLDSEIYLCVQIFIVRCNPVQKGNGQGNNHCIPVSSYGLCNVLHTGHRLNFLIRARKHGKSKKP